MNLSKLSSAIYDDAKKNNFILKEDYVETVSNEIWPDYDIFLRGGLSLQTNRRPFLV